jgi:hypothetical protein
VARGAKGHRWQAPGNREEKKEEDGSPIEPGMTNEDGSPVVAEDDRAGKGWQGPQPNSGKGHSLIEEKMDPRSSRG